MDQKSRKISEIWSDKTLKKVFLDIISNTQLRKCKRMKPMIIRRLTTVLRERPDITDAEIYDLMYDLVHRQTPLDLRKKIQHKATYRNVNRANKIVEFITQYMPMPSSQPKSVLDLGCGEGNITNVVGRMLKLPQSGIHGCDVKAMPQDHLFSYTMLTDDGLPYQDGIHDVVYAFMSLHHIHHVDKTLQEIFRVLRSGGLFILREHDCVTKGLAKVLDVIHGFYSMVWSNPREKKDFEAEYWAQYRTANQLHVLIESFGFKRLLDTSRDEKFPLFYKGKVINPLKYYYAVYMKP